MKSVTHSIFKTFLLSALVVAQMHFAYAQTASILPPAKTTFLDANGKPLTAGTVESFIPTTSTHKTTWQDAAETIPNANPLTLDAAGRALLLGSGSYRQLVKDRLGNTIWDQVTSSTGSGGGGGTVATGDGDLVGTIKPWAGMTAPNQYVFTYGQELSRTTYSALFTAITSTQAIFCNSGSPILSGLSDTSNFWIGMSIELSCVAPGFTTIISKTATTVTMAINANVTTGTNAVFFPWGRGNGSTTFNMPDFRGFAIAGNNIMGGVSGSQLTTTFFGATDPNSSGAAGGSQSKTLILANEVPYTPTGTNSNSVVALSYASSTTYNTTGATKAISDVQSGSGLATPVNAVAASQVFTGTAQGGGLGSAASAVVAAGGAGYTSGAQTLTVSGGTCTTQPQFTVTVVANAITAPVLLNAGLCSIAPVNPTSTTGGGGTGGTLIVTYTQAPFATIQPTKTSNYIIKVLPDDNSATASGVTALGGMTGSIICGNNLICTGNTISANGLTVLAPSALATAAVLPNTPIYTNGASGVGATLTAGSNTTLTVDGTVATLNAVVLVKNQASAFQNGIYTVTTAGGGVPWVLTRATYFDTAAEMLAGSYTFISAGTTNVNTAYSLQTTITLVGTDNLNWLLFSAGNVTGPISAVSGNLASYASTTGKTLQDSGIATTSVVQGSGSPVVGDLAAFSNTTATTIAGTGYNATQVPGLIPTTSTVTITNASPGIVSWTSHGLTANTPVFFCNSGGALNTGLTACVPASVGTVSANTYLSNPTLYYVCSGATLLTNSFAVATTIANAKAGTCVNTSSAGSGTQTAFANAMACKGCVGELVWNTITIANSVAAVSGSAGQVWNTISIDAGIWEVWGNSGVIKQGAGTPVFSHMHAGIVYGFSTIPSSPFNGTVAQHVTSNDPNGWMLANRPEQIFLTGTTTINAVATTDFAPTTANTAGLYGTTWARRIK